MVCRLIHDDDDNDDDDDDDNDTPSLLVVLLILALGANKSSEFISSFCFSNTLMEFFKLGMTRKTEHRKKMANFFCSLLPNARFSLSSGEFGKFFRLRRKPVLRPLAIVLLRSRID